MNENTKIGVGFLIVAGITYLYSRNEKAITKDDLLNKDNLSLKSISNTSFVLGGVFLLIGVTKK
jgi:hypothetical protein